MTAYSRNYWFCKKLSSEKASSIKLQSKRKLPHLPLFLPAKCCFLARMSCVQGCVCRAGSSAALFCSRPPRHWGNSTSHKPPSHKATKTPPQTNGDDFAQLPSVPTALPEEQSGAEGLWDVRMEPCSPPWAARAVGACWVQAFTSIPQAQQPPGTAGRAALPDLPSHTQHEH